MPEKTVPTPDRYYTDEHVTFGIEPTARPGEVFLAISSGGCSATARLTVPGAQRLSAMLDRAVTAALARDPKAGR